VISLDTSYKIFYLEQCRYSLYEFSKLSVLPQSFKHSETSIKGPIYSTGRESVSTKLLQGHKYKVEADKSPGDTLSVLSVSRPLVFYGHLSNSTAFSS
jgi:hypothetical protein